MKLNADFDGSGLKTVRPFIMSVLLYISHKEASIQQPTPIDS